MTALAFTASGIMSGLLTMVAPKIHQQRAYYVMVLSFGLAFLTWVVP